MVYKYEEAPSDFAKFSDQSDLMRAEVSE
nr:transcriptional activator RinB [Staphylococcus aureus]